MALTTVVEECAGLHHFQIVRRAADCLALRADPAETSPKPNAADIAARALKAYLDRQGACSVHVVVDPQPPQRDRASGKLRQVVAPDCSAA
jgi:hypothetical protein